jgi:hypothetical protein
MASRRPLGARNNVTVCVERERNRCMPQCLARDLRVNAVLQEAGGLTESRVVTAHTLLPSLRRDPTESVGEGVGLYRSAILTAEHAIPCRFGRRS